MKLRITVWTLSWDTDSGTDCLVFGSEEEWFAYFHGVIESAIQNFQTQKADEIRRALTERDLGLAYTLWQNSYKPELDTYNWDQQEIVVDASASPALALP